MEIKVENDVPIPAGPAVKGSGIAAALRGMRVGQSFEIPNVANIRSNIYGTAKLAGVKIKTRGEGDRLRVWRIA